jgi:transcriptional regulator with XRE-family HTH domain
LEHSLSKYIIKLRKFLQISQSELGRRVGVSPMAISRWERNLSIPIGTQLIKLGNLAHEDSTNCWNFWNLAGLTLTDVVKVLPIAQKRFRRTIPILRVVSAGPKKLRLKQDADSLVAIPFLNVFAAAGKGRGSSNDDLTLAHSDHIIAAPRLWCPNPNHTVCMRVKGTSMEPTLLDGYIIVVDQRQADKNKLNRMMIVAHHKKFGLVVSRFWKVKDSEALVSDNRRHDPVPWSSTWHVVGKVLWWIGEPAQQAS